MNNDELFDVLWDKRLALWEGSAILYNPKNPAELVAALNQKFKNHLHQKGFREINRKRLGSFLTSYREALAYKPEDMLPWLDDQFGIEWTEEEYQQVELGTAAALFVTVTNINQISRLLKVPLEHLITK